jgi:hypothetical protein
MGGKIKMIGDYFFKKVKVDFNEKEYIFVIFVVGRKILLHIYKMYNTTLLKVLPTSG